MEHLNEGSKRLVKSQGEILQILPGRGGLRVPKMASAEDVHVSRFGKLGKEGLKRFADKKLNSQGRWTDIYVFSFAL